MKHHVGRTRNGVEVYAYLTSSKVGKSLSRQPRLLTLAKEMLSTVTLRSPDVTIEHDMQRQIGYDFVITTTDKHAIFYARLLKDTVYTRFAKNGEPTPTNYLTLVLHQDSDKDYELYDIWIGQLTPPRPGSTNETTESKPYWSNHAFVLVDQPLQTRSLTKTCPY